jgi:hypothetical protein
MCRRKRMLLRARKKPSARADSQWANLPLLGNVVAKRTEEH